MSLRYKLDDTDTDDYRSVAFAIVKAFNEGFPGEDAFYIPRVMTDVKHMFSGEFDNLQPIDTKYHDLEHTMQASLCFTRIVINRHLAKIEPLISANDFKLGLLATLLHDTGYLKREGDEEGTGAKYTNVHEQRSCEYAARYLNHFNLETSDIATIQNMINCTGPFADIPSVPFTDKIGRILGESVCTADYIGQMSDHNYVWKLYHLFQEFEESNDHNNIPESKRPFASFDDLFEETPAFWDKIVKPRLHVECHDLWKLLASPFPDGPNPYISAIEANIAKVEQIIKDKSCSYRDTLQAMARAL